MSVCLFSISTARSVYETFVSVNHRSLLFSSQRTNNAYRWCVLIISLNKLFNKQWSCRPCRPCDVVVMLFVCSLSVHHGSPRCCRFFFLHTDRLSSFLDYIPLSGCDLSQLARAAVPPWAHLLPRHRQFVESSWRRYQVGELTHCDLDLGPHWLR